MSLGGVYQDLQLRVRLDYSLLNVYIFFPNQIFSKSFAAYTVPDTKGYEHGELQGKTPWEWKLQRKKKKKAQSVMLKGFRERCPAGQETLWG